MAFPSAWARLRRLPAAVRERSPQTGHERAAKIEPTLRLDTVEFLSQCFKYVSRSITFCDLLLATYPSYYAICCHRRDIFCSNGILFGHFVLHLALALSYCLTLVTCTAYGPRVNRL